MADSNEVQPLIRRPFWIQRISVTGVFNIFVARAKSVLGLGNQRTTVEDVLRERDNLRQQVDSLLAERQVLASKIDSDRCQLQDENYKQIKEMRDEYESQIHVLSTELTSSKLVSQQAEDEYRNQVAHVTSKNNELKTEVQQLTELADQQSQASQQELETLKCQLDVQAHELESLSTRIRETESSSQRKDAAQKARVQELEEKTAIMEARLDAALTTARERTDSLQAEVDEKIRFLAETRTELSAVQLRLHEQDKLLRSALKQLKSISVSPEDERVRSIVMKIEEGLPRRSYPIDNEEHLNNSEGETPQRRALQMKQTQQRLLADTQKQANNAFPSKESSKSSEPSQSSASSKAVEVDSDDGRDRSVFEQVLSSMRVALPQVKFRMRDSNFNEERAIQEDTSQSTNKDSASSPQNHDAVTRSTAPQHSTPKSNAFATSQIDLKEQKRREFYSKWPKRIYDSLPLAGNSLRLVDILAGSGDEEIRLKVAIYEMKNVSNQYEALSYTCGQQREGFWITLNDNRVEIYPNLYKALQWLRQPRSPRRMWIDAICINQRSRNEMSKEVQKMGPIYSQARTVTIFLGAPQPSSLEKNLIGTFMRFLNRKISHIVSQQAHLGSDVLKTACRELDFDAQEVRLGFLEFCSQSWWRRIWTMQEFYLAPEEPVFYWGNDTCNTAALKRDFDLLRKSVNYDHEPGTNDTQGSTIMKGLLSGSEISRLSRYVTRSFRFDGFDTPRRLYSDLAAQATDPHDYIYGLRAIFDPVFQEVFVPDYQMSPEMLFACLAVYLIAVEGWTDLLWWYPHRYRALSQTASWWPDFSSRVMAHELDVQPRPINISEEPRLTCAVADHMLYAEGYLMDKVYAHRHIHKHDGYKIFSELWQFDHCMNWNHECNDFFNRVTEDDDEWVRKFKQMHRDRYTELTHFNSSFKGSLLQSTINEESRGKFPTQISECVPAWDILRWHAYRIEVPGLPIVLGRDFKRDKPGCLEDIFSSRMSDTFQKAFADFFIGACIFDWNHLFVWLVRFPRASQWAPHNRRYWESTMPSSDGLDTRSKIIAEAYNGYMSEINEEIMRNSWCYSFYYVFLAYVILLDCDDHQSLAEMIKRLIEAGERLREIFFSIQLPQLRRYAPKVPTLTRRLQLYELVIEMFRDRFLVWTYCGFRGISCPGLDTCCADGSVVVILDGLSFPAVINDFDETTGEGRLVGCVLLRGIDMLARDAETALLPADYVRGTKRKFILK